MPRLIELRATIVSGRGLASTLRAEDVAGLSQLQGAAILDGSLNLVCSSPIWLDVQSAIFVGNTGHLYWPAHLEGIPVLLDRWNCPAHIFEVFSATHLRSKLNLQDNDAVTLSIPSEIVDSEENRRRANRLVWRLVWSGREKLFYTSNRYLSCLRRFGRLVQPSMQSR